MIRSYWTVFSKVTVPQRLPLFRVSRCVYFRQSKRTNLERCNSFFANGDHPPICRTWRSRVWAKGVSLYPTNLHVCLKNKAIYREKTEWSSVIVVCVCAGPTFVTLSEYRIFYGTMARKPYVDHWIECPVYSARRIGLTIGVSGRRKMNR